VPIAVVGGHAIRHFFNSPEASNIDPAVVFNQYLSVTTRQGVLHARDYWPAERRKKTSHLPAKLFDRRAIPKVEKVEKAIAIN
jgi:hypothetical protein